MQGEFSFRRFRQRSPKRSTLQFTVLILLASHVSLRCCGCRLLASFDDAGLVRLKAIDIGKTAKTTTIIVSRPAKPPQHPPTPSATTCNVLTGRINKECGRLLRAPVSAASWYCLVQGGLCSPRRIHFHHHISRSTIQATPYCSKRSGSYYCYLAILFAICNISGRSPSPNLSRSRRL